MMHGIYQIQNLVNSKLYLGSTTVYGFNRRWRSHSTALKRNKHSNRHLQFAWNKHGEEVFIFEVIEYVIRLDEMTDKEWKTLVLQREQYYLDTILFASCKDQRFHKLGYNICRRAGNTLGCKMSEKTKAEMSKAHSGENNPMHGRNHSASTKKKIAMKATGREHSIESRRKMSESRKGKQVGSDNPMYGSIRSRGELNAQARLTINNIKDIKKLLTEGISQYIIAQLFNVRQSTISRINTGKRWGHISG